MVFKIKFNPLQGFLGATKYSWGRVDKRLWKVYPGLVTGSHYQLGKLRQKWKLSSALIDVWSWEWLNLNPSTFHEIFTKDMSKRKICAKIVLNNLYFYVVLHLIVKLKFRSSGECWGPLYCHDSLAYLTRTLQLTWWTSTSKLEGLNSFILPAMGEIVSLLFFKDGFGNK